MDAKKVAKLHLANTYLSVLVKMPHPKLLFAHFFCLLYRACTQNPILFCRFLVVAKAVLRTCKDTFCPLGQLWVNG